MHSSRDSRTTRLRLAALACTVMLGGGCMMQDQSAPELSGPSGFGLSLTMTASPAVLPRDGSSQSTITVTARDSSGAGIANVSFVANVSPDSAPLQQLSPATGSDGVLRFVLTAPTLSTVAANNQVVVSIAAIGDDFQNANARSVSLGLLGPSNATYPTPEFTIAPEAPKAMSAVVFDASPTTDEGVRCETCTFDWSIAGQTTSGSAATYTFPAAGAYAVTLTVTDITGSTRSVTKAVEIAAAETTGTP